MSVQVQMGVVVRRHEPSDDPFIARLARSAFGEFSDDAVGHTLALTRTRHAVTLVAVRGAKPVGFAVVQLTRDGAFLQAVGVERAARGMGIGRRLLNGAERVARSNGAAVLRLCTADSNLEALDLFLKRGFVIERRLAHYYSRGQTACALCKRLST